MAGVVAHAEECLASMHEALISIPSVSQTGLVGLVVHSCSPSTQEQ